MAVALDLADLNAVLTELGYHPINASQREDLEAVLGLTFETLVGDARTMGSESQHWLALRSALYGASGHCERAMRAAGLTLSRRQTIQASMRLGREYRLRLAAVLAARDAGQGAPEDAIRWLSDELGIRMEPGSAHKAKPLTNQISQAKLHHVYGKNYALTFESTTTRAGQGCLQVEAAARSTRGSGFAWDQKISLQLVDHEVVDLILALRGKVSEAVFAHHGSAKDKEMTVRLQRDSRTIYVNIRQRGVSRTVPVPFVHSYRIEGLAVGVLAANEPGATVQDVMARITALAAHPLAKPH